MISAYFYALNDVSCHFFVKHYTSCSDIQDGINNDSDECKKVLSASLMNSS